MKNIKCFSRSFLTVLFLGLFTGCTHMMKVSLQPTALPAGQKLPHHAALVLNQELANYKYEFHMMGDKWVFPFGPPLQDYARNVTAQSFQQVQVAPSFEKACEDTAADIILIPRPVKADQGVGVWVWNKNNFTLVVEWVAKDRATKNTVWLKTITADASETAGNAFTGKKHQKVLFQKLFDDLSLKTHKAFQESPELRSSQPK